MEDMTDAELSSPPLPDLPERLRMRLDRCRSILKHLGRVVVAYSGGVDSTLLLALAVETVGPENVLAAVGISPSLPARERAEARKLARGLGARLVEVETCELADPAFAANPDDRCFHCKSELVDRLEALAEREGFDAVCLGANADDLDDIRPGILAGESKGAFSPLMEAALTKDDIRRASRAMGLATWNKPAYACLASRIPYGQPITAEKLARIERAEDLLGELGFAACRVRDHGRIARIEVPPADIDRLVSCRDRIVEQIKELGYAYVTADLEGYRTGSMNEVLGS